MNEPFGFEIYEYTKGHWEDGKYINEGKTGEIAIQLPHSCDNWVIATGTKEGAQAELERFIKEAQETLEKLHSL